MFFKIIVMLVRILLIIETMGVSSRRKNEVKIRKRGFFYASNDNKCFSLVFCFLPTSLTYRQGIGPELKRSPDPAKYRISGLGLKSPKTNLTGI